jgi:hypothetical protein
VLSLLPLLPFADPRFRPAMLALPISNLASYSLYFPLDGNTTVLVRAVSEIAQVVIVIVPPTVILLACWRNSRAARPGNEEAQRCASQRVSRARLNPAPASFASDETSISG